MNRVLWLAFETIPHPDAVVAPLAEDEATFVLSLMVSPRPHRISQVIQLRNALQTQTEQSLWSRELIPCRTSQGLYILLSWRLAKWLSLVLAAEDSILDGAACRIRQWLENGASEEVCSPLA